MPRYFFDLANGDGLLRDEEGAELNDIERARAFALHSAREVAASEIREGREIQLSHFVTIRDTAGAELERVSFSEAIRIVQ